MASKNLTPLKNLIQEMVETDQKRLKITTRRSMVLLEEESSEERAMRLHLYKIFKMITLPPSKRDTNTSKLEEKETPKYVSMSQSLLQKLQDASFRFVDSGSLIDFMEAYSTIMGLVMDKKLYCDFVVLHRMRANHVFKVWEGLGDFLQDRGYPTEAFVIYAAVALMRSETCPRDLENIMSLEKAIELASKINSNPHAQRNVNGFCGILKKWGNIEKGNMSLLLETLLFKALVTHFSRNGIDFHAAIDFEIKYLSKMFEMGYFSNNIEWLICNLLNLVLLTMDVRIAGVRLKQAKHLLHVIRVLMGRCSHTEPRYQTLYDTYQLCKCIYWCTKINTNMQDVSTRFQCFMLVSMGVRMQPDPALAEVSLIQNEYDVAQTFKKIVDLREILEFSTNIEIAQIYNEILRTCCEKFSYLKT